MNKPAMLMIYKKTESMDAFWFQLKIANRLSKGSVLRINLAILSTRFISRERYKKGKLVMVVLSNRQNIE